MIKISEEYYIDADSHCYMLKEKTINTDENSTNYGKETITILGYYTSIEYCLDGLLKTKTRKYIQKETMNSLKELKEYIESESKFLRELKLN